MILVNIVLMSLPKKLLLRMPHTEGGETSSRREFSHRPRPSTSDNKVHSILDREEEEEAEKKKNL